MTQISVDDRDPETFTIIGAAMTVHTALGSGFLEPVYQDALGIEFHHQNIPHTREVTLPIFYRNEPLNAHYKADFICFGTLIVELKAQSRLTSSDDAQVLNYLKASRFHRALLFNFGAPRLEYERLVLSGSHHQSSKQTS
jgi:GxxExxY protein